MATSSPFATRLPLNRSESFTNTVNLVASNQVSLLS